MSGELESLSSVGKYWNGIKNLIQRNIDEGTFPCIVIMFDGNYDVLRQVVKEMGLHTKKRRRKHVEGLVVCASPTDRRKPIVRKQALGAIGYRIVEGYPGRFGRDFKIVMPGEEA